MKNQYIGKLIRNNPIVIPRQPNKAVITHIDTIPNLKRSDSSTIIQNKMLTSKRHNKNQIAELEKTSPNIKALKLPKKVEQLAFSNCTPKT